MSYKVDTLDCEQCGDTVKRLTPVEAQQVASNPHNFVVYCNPCKRELKRSLND